MRILVTGGAGCLGSELAGHYSEKGHEVLVFDNFQTGSKEWVPSNPKVITWEGSVASPENLGRAFSHFEPTHVIHAAASYADPNDWEGDLETNALGSLNVVKASELHRVEKLVYLQTALGYGRPTISPIPVDHQLNPSSSYGISKVAGELYVLAAELPSSVSLRLANVCAPRLSIGPLPTFFKRLQANEECVVTSAERDFLSIADFLDLIDRVFDHEFPVKGAFNVSSGGGRTIQEVFEAVAAEMGIANPRFRTIPLGNDDIESVVLSPEGTRQVFGWSAQTDFSETVKQQVDWFKLHGVGTIRSHLKENSAIEKESDE